MTGNHWRQRNRPPTAPSELNEIRAAAEDLAHQAGQTPGKTGTVFHTVSQVTLISTALVSGALGLVHLWKTFSVGTIKRIKARNPVQQGPEARRPTSPAIMLRPFTPTTENAGRVAVDSSSCAKTLSVAFSSHDRTAPTIERCQRC